MDIDTKKVILTIDHLNAHHNEPVFLLVLDDKYSIRMIGCRTIADIHKYAIYYSIFNAEDLLDPDKFILLKATPIDPTDLPYELHIIDEAFVIYEDWYISGPLENMRDVTMDIEEMFEAFADSEIEDFAVLVGRSVGEHLKEGMIRRLKNATREI